MCVIYTGWGSGRAGKVLWGVGTGRKDGGGHKREGGIERE